MLADLVGCVTLPDTIGNNTIHEELKIMDCLKWIFPTQSSWKLIFHAKIRLALLLYNHSQAVVGVSSGSTKQQCRSGNGILIREEKSFEWEFVAFIL